MAGSIEQTYGRNYVERLQMWSIEPAEASERIEMNISISSHSWVLDWTDGVAVFACKNLVCSETELVFQVSENTQNFDTFHVSIRAQKAIVASYTQVRCLPKRALGDVRD
eukprot:318637-Rhodomonas_salina.1